MNLVMQVSAIVGHPVNRRKKFRAFLNFVRWQAGIRLLGSRVVFQWIEGSKAIVGRGEVGMTANVYNGLHEFEDMAYVLHLIDDQDMFVDIGANVGSYTILACAVKGAHGICCEPVPSTYEKLLDNIGINRLQSRVTPLPIGVSDQAGQLRFSTMKYDVYNHAILEDGTDSIEPSVLIPVQTLDSILSGISATAIKIDVEGFETMVVAGAQRTLADTALHSVIMEMNGSGDRYGFSEDDLERTMKNFGFLPCAYDPFTRRLTPLNSKSRRDGNTLFVRNLEAVQAKLLAARRFCWNGIEF